MNAISAYVNFKENLSRNIPYYSLLAAQLSGGAEVSATCEHACLSAQSGSSVISRVCEGYQFDIVFSGRLLNKEELYGRLTDSGYHVSRDADGELALFAYIHFGEKSPSLLSGSFSYIIYDSMRRQIFAAVDPYSALPLYWWGGEESYVLSSALGGILSCEKIPAEISLDGVSQLLIPKQHKIGDIFENITRLAPGHFLKLTASGVLKKAYTLPEKTPDEALTDNCGSSCGVIFMGMDGEDLFEAVAEAEEASSRRVSVYTYFPIKVKHSPRIYRLSLDAGSLLSGLEASVTACALPVLSAVDYLLQGILKCADGRSDTLFAVSPDYGEISGLTFPDIGMLHPRVFESVTEGTGIPINTLSLIGYSYGSNIHMPQKSSAYKDYADFSGIRPHLRRILLEIISKDYAPVLAFFRRSALLSLCEGVFKLPLEAECALIAYIIKLNIWFTKYRPRII